MRSNVLAAAKKLAQAKAAVDRANWPKRNELTAEVRDARNAFLDALAADMLDDDKERSA